MNKNSYSIILLILLLLAVAVNFNILCQGITNSLHDFHEYRQTQTAITSYYFLKEGFRLNYITPILGYPFQLTMEFPLYQMIVAVVVKITGWQLEMTGRLVSIFFFFSFLVVYYKILELLKLDKKIIVAAFILIVLSPTYLFWTRTFMIESTALFLTAFFFYGVLYQIRNQQFNYVLLIFTSLAGTLAALQKVTTFLPAGFAIGIYYLFAVWTASNGSTKEFLNNNLSKKGISIAIFAFILPLIGLIVWTRFADQAKTANPLAQKWISSNLRSWNYGTLNQKTSLAVWLKIVANTFIFGKINTIIFFGLVFANALIAKYTPAIKMAICFLLLFIAFPLAFTNLHQEHEYYCYGNCFLLLTGIAMLFHSIQINNKFLQWVPLGLTVLFALALISRYSFYLKPYTIEKANPYAAYTKKIQEQVAPNDLLLIYNNAMNSNLTYYAQRKSLSLSYIKSVNHPLFNVVIQNQNQYKFGALVVSKMDGSVDSSFVQQLVQRFGFENRPSFVNQVDGAAVYFKKQSL